VVYFTDGDNFHNDMDKWHQRAAEWKCAPECLVDSGDEKNDSDDEDVELDGDQDVMQDALELIQEVPLLEAEEIETEDKSTNTECVFVQTKVHHRGSGSKPISLTKGSIVIKRSQTFSPSAVVNKNDYVCRVSFHLSLVCLF